MTTQPQLPGMPPDTVYVNFHVITARSAITIPEIQDLFRQGEAKPPAYALEKGIIHEVGDFVIPNGAPIVTVNVKQPH